jgi:alpha-tubulin suppressor-like RCC1 family protein
VKRRSVGAGLCGIIAALAFTAGCSVEVPPTPVVVQQQPTSIVEYWGSLFGGMKDTNYDTRLSPTAVALPGRVAEVGTSNSTQYALMTDGTLYAWGLGSQGQLGDGSSQNSFGQPVRVRFPRGVKIASIPTDAMPYDSALAVDTRGRVWGWGNNGGGELCLGTSRAYVTPVMLPLSHVTAVAGASNHALFDAGGTVYACGQNVDGDLGDGSARGSSTPVRVAGLSGSPVTKLVASFADSGALLSDGEYLDWGYDGAGQLGDGHVRRSSNVPVRVDLPLPVTQVAQGGSIWSNGQTLVMLSNGSLWSWGSDMFSQLGDGKTGIRSTPERFRPPAGVAYATLATGSATSYAVSTTGKVYAWGVSFTGQVGDGLTRTARTPVLVASGAAAISSTANDVAISVPRNRGNANGVRGRLAAP